MEPSNEVLTLFGVRLVASLGGRINRYWLVEVRGKKFVLRCWGQSPLIDEAASHTKSIRYEVRLVAALAAQGWPVATIVAGPTETSGQVWSLAPFLPGDVPVMDRRVHGDCKEQRARGRLLAEFHAGLAQLPDFGQRPGWRRCEEVLADPALDSILRENQQERPEEVSILRWHLNRARSRAAELSLYRLPSIVIHGDWTPWNLRFVDGRLSGILDFELAHWDYGVGDFALSWRGKYDDVILGYDEVSPLEPEEWALIAPLWWTQLISHSCRDLQRGTLDDGWTIKKLLERSPLMGADAEEYRA